MAPSTEAEFAYPLFESDPLKMEKYDEKKINGATMDDGEEEALKDNANGKQTKYRRQIVWKNVALMAAVHLFALYGVYLVPRAQVKTLFYVWVLGILSTLGVQAGKEKKDGKVCFPNQKSTVIWFGKHTFFFYRTHKTL